MNSHTVTIAQGSPVTIADASISVALLDVKDERCPTNVRCIWAGHAAVTLKVSADNGSSETLVIGTQAPPDMQLPFEADYGAYRISLVALEPSRATSEPMPTSNYRATVRITKR